MTGDEGPAASNAVPLLLDFRARRVLCVGAGPVAARKVLPLVEAGAHVTVVAPTAVEALRTGEVSWERRPWRPGDLDVSPLIMLVLAATGDATVDADVADEAEQRGIWCLRTDGAGTVTVPAVVRRGALLLALSTGVPALTRALREHLEETLENRWAVAADVLGRLRRDPEVRASLSHLPFEERRARWRAATKAALDTPGERNAVEALARTALGTVVAAVSGPDSA